MKEFNNINEILDFAMGAEQRAVDLYTSLAEEAKIEDMRVVFMQFAKEEMGHKVKLLKIKEEGTLNIPDEKVMDMKIADYSGEIKATDNMDYQDALLFAMSQEKAAFKLYSALADRAPTADLKKAFQALAQEEAKHKLRFELEYDEFVLRDN
jgi:rubrerythrin